MALASRNGYVDPRGLRSTGQSPHFSQEEHEHGKESWRAKNRAELFVTQGFDIDQRTRAPDMDPPKGL